MHFFEGVQEVQKLAQEKLHFFIPKVATLLLTQLMSVINAADRCRNMVSCMPSGVGA
jgi:hypothetical protein